MKIYFNNIRWLKTKWESFTDIVEEYNPDFIGLVETHLEEKEIIEKIEGYVTIRSE